METNPDNRQETFMELYTPVHTRLARYVQTIVWNREDAKDIIGETLLKAYENFDQVRNPESFIYYLFTIARRLAFKSEKRKRWWGLYDHTTTENMADTGENILALAEMNELKRALGNLPGKQKEAIVLFEITGFSLAEIQKIQGGSLSGVKSRLVRAREELRRVLEYREKSTAVRPLPVSKGLNAVI